MPETRKNGRFFTLQWHITALCSNKCRQCYMYDSPTYSSECRNPLSLDACKAVIDDFAGMLDAWQMQGRINLSGGDPLMRPEVYDIISYARERNIQVGILGNPEFLNKQVAQRLKRLGLRSYQVSIDGLEPTHDSLRSPGSFLRTIRGLKLLRDAGIYNVVMFTLSKLNAHELIPVIRIVNDLKVDVFDFARLVPVGSGEQLKNSLISSEEYHALLLEVLGEYRQLKKLGGHTYFGRKDHLWKLLYDEIGMLGLLPDDKETIFDGCGLGVNLLTVLADGSVMACRRLPIVIGKVPEQSLREIFIDSEALNQMRQDTQITKCGYCHLRQFCRGCRAVAYGTTGSYLAADPQCWKKDGKSILTR